MEELDFSRLDKAFDKCCVKSVQNLPNLRKDGKELLVFAQHHPNRPLVLQNVREQLYRHYTKRKSYRDHNRFKANAQLIMQTIADFFMCAIKTKRDQDNLSEMERIRIAQGDKIKNDVAQLIREVPRDGSTEERN